MSVRVIIGDDDYLVDEAARKTVGDGVGLELIDSMTATNEDLQLADLRRADESFSTPPFLDPKKVTWWRNVHFLPGGKSSAAVKEALEKFAKKVAALAPTMPPNQHFVLSGPHLLKNSVFAKAFAGVAELVSFGGGKPWERRRTAVARAVELAAEEELAFADGVAEKFVAVVGTDSRSIAGEVAKMRTYLGPGAKKIEAKDVDAVTSPGAKDEPEIWAVTDAIGKRDAAAAIAALEPFALMNGFAVFMTGVIEKFFRQLVDLKRGGIPEDMNPFVAKKSAAFLAKWTLLELRSARARFIALREKVVSGTTAGDVLVVTELLRAVRRAPRR